MNLVLTVRKAVSLGISVWYYGSGLNSGLAIGGVMVLCKQLLPPDCLQYKLTRVAGTLIYSFAPAPQVINGDKKVLEADSTSSDALQSSSTAMDDLSPKDSLRNRATSKEEVVDR